MNEIVAAERLPVRAASIRREGEIPWRRAMKSAVRDPGELCRLLELPAELAEPARRAAETFPLFVPLAFAAKMEKGDPRDPLLLQVLPLPAEGEERSGFAGDAVGDLAATLSPGLIHKYRGRVLLIAAGACAIHCRYCFRREFPYGESPRGLEAWRPAIEAIAADGSIEEVILSGGDPLTLADEQLSALAGRLAEIPHLKRLRVHSRLPVVIPERITAELLAWLRGTRLTPVFVIHANHPREIDGPVEAALGRLVDAGVPVLNQAVLLRGINDGAAVLAELCLRLVNARVLPYYLHQLDRVRGTGHFEVPPEEGGRIMRELSELLPGYALPRYVREIPGEGAKRSLA